MLHSSPCLALTPRLSLYFVGAGRLITMEFRSSLSERSISISLMMPVR